MFVFSRSLVFTIIFSFGFYLTYNQVFNGYPSDIMAHIGHAKHLFPLHEFEVSYPMWHMIVYGTSVLFDVSMKQSAVIVNALIIVILAITIFNIIRFTLKDELTELSVNQKECVFLAMTVFLMTASAVYVPFFNKFLYIGQGNSGVWHSVTLFMVKPLAFLSVFSVALYFDSKKLKWAVVAMTSALLSIYAKPSFIIAFLPAIYLSLPIFVMQEKELNIVQVFSRFVEMIKCFRREVFFVLVLSLLSILAIWGQYTILYSDVNTSKVVFDFLGVWSSYTSNVAVSFMLTYLFPLAVFFLVKDKDNKAYTLSLVMTLVSVFLFSVFAEEGPRYAHGNFGWSQQISVQILFAFSLIEFVRHYNILDDCRKYILSMALSMHMVSGIFYVIKISNGLHYG